MLNQVFFLSAFFFYLTPLLAQLEETKLFTNSPLEMQEFGISLAANDAFLVVGAPETHLIGGKGRAFVFENIDDIWVQQTVLIANDAELEDIFGNAIAIFENRVVVGAQWDDDNGNRSGSAYVYIYDGENWTQEAKIVPSDGEPLSNFGKSVAISNNRIAIAASNSVYVYKLMDETWEEEIKLVNNSSEDNLGNSIDLNDNRLVTGAGPQSFIISVYVYKLFDEQWEFEAKLQADDGNDNDRFGQSLAIQDQKIIVGSPFNLNTGAVYEFSFEEENWIQTNKITGSNNSPFEKFGTSVYIYNDDLLIGAVGDDFLGKVYNFHYSAEQWNEMWIAQSNETSPVGFGRDVVYSSGFAVTGAPDDSQFGNSNGAIFLYQDITSSIENNEIQSSASLSQNSPNPFRELSFIECEINQKVDVSLIIYTIDGKIQSVLMDGNYPPGTYRFQIDAADLVGSAYVYILQYNGKQIVKKMVVEH